LSDIEIFEPDGLEFSFDGQRPVGRIKKHHGKILHVIERPSESVLLVGLNRAVRKRAANQSGTGSADDAILGWHSLHQLSHWATAGYGA